MDHRFLVSAVLLLASPSQAAGPAACPFCAASDDPAPALDRTVLTGPVYALPTTWQTDDGRTVTLDTLRGHACVAALFFTTCHVACPVTLDTLAAVDRNLPADSKVSILLVTIDPATDTASLLSQCRSEHRLSGRVLMLRGGLSQTQSFADAAGIVYKREPSRLVHMPRIVVLGRDGRVAAAFPGLRLSPADIARAAQAADLAAPAVAVAR